MPAEDSVKLVQMRNEFYRDNYKRVVYALLFMLITNAILVGIVFFQLTHKPTPQYFATSADGKIVKLYPLSQPVVSPQALLQWASVASVEAYSYDFVNYRKSLQALQNKFTMNGWKFFQVALKRSRMLETITTKKLVVSAVATGSPVILDKGIVDGRYTWKVNIPLLITYESASERTQQSVSVTMLISRIQTVNHPEGIAIESFVSSVTARV